MLSFDLTCKRGHFELQSQGRLSHERFTVLMGSSGSGKTTLLRCLAGLQRPKGTIVFSGHTLQDANHFVPPHQRPIGFVMQRAYLPTHLRVDEILRLATQYAIHQGMHNRFDTVIDHMCLSHLLHRNPNQLSGGESQRVALAAVFLRGAPLILLDEPLSSLDALARNDLTRRIKSISRALSATCLYVSHHHDETLLLADDILTMDQGRIVRHESLSEYLYRHPKDLGSFEGLNVLNASAQALQISENGATVSIGHEVIKVKLPSDNLQGVFQKRLRVFIDPQQIFVSNRKQIVSPCENQLFLRVDEIQYLLDHDGGINNVLIRCNVAEQMLWTTITVQQQLSEGIGLGSLVSFCFKVAKMEVL